jgi:hypothetical protein
MRCGPRWKERVKLGAPSSLRFRLTLCRRTLRAPASFYILAHRSLTQLERFVHRSRGGTLSAMTWTADSFVKTLRQSNDVQLAVDAYNDQAFYLPAKPQLLADWALNRLLKYSAAIEEVKIWLLLQDILFGNSSTAPAWLPAVLYKIPVVPILTSIFRLLVESPQHALPLEHVLPVLRSILPIAYPKTRLDTILECLWACIDALSSICIDTLVSDLAFLVLDGFPPAFQTASNKGKVRVSWQARNYTKTAVDIRHLCEGASFAMGCVCRERKRPKIA